MPLLDIQNLNIHYPSRYGINIAVSDFSLTIERGEIFGLIGESGAGKSTVGNAVADILQPPAYIDEGQILLDGERIDNISDKQMYNYRGNKIGFIFQDPMTSLNPLFTIEEQICEVLIQKKGMSKKEAASYAIDLLKRVRIPNATTRIKQYPHQFSGGMRQRVVIAIAVSCEPDLLIADEPVTALDVSVQDQILTLIKELCEEKNIGCILVTHDMGVVANVTNRVGVMYQGKLIEVGNTKDILSNPQQDYTKKLMSAVPRTDKKLHRFPLISHYDELHEQAAQNLKQGWQASQNMSNTTDAMLKVQNLDLTFNAGSGLFSRKKEYVHAVKDVSFEIKRGETFGLIGESGSGKSTIARIITGLYHPNKGKMFFNGSDISKKLNKEDKKLFQRQIQMIFQNPYFSLNPKMRIFNIIAEPLYFYELADSKKEVKKIVDGLLDYVGLGASAGVKYPHEFSGGQRQRVSIARSLAAHPELLICDEPTSALDVSVQAQILNLLKDLQEELGLTMLFISHDLPVIRQMCDNIAIMRLGELLEVAPTEELFNSPKHEYTKHLLELMPNFQTAFLSEEVRKTPKALV